MHKTERQATGYAQRMAYLTEEPWHWFVIPEGTGAYLHGGRWGTFRDSQRAAYEADGAVVSGTAYPERANAPR